MNLTFAKCITGPIKRRYRASRINDHEWEPYHEEIRAKYVDENYTLDQLMQYMSTVRQFHPTKKQYTSYFNKQKIRKADKFSSFELSGPQYSPTTIDCQSSTSTFEEDDPLDGPTSNLDQVTIKLDAHHTTRGGGVLPGSTPMQRSLLHSSKDTLDEHVLNTICGAQDGENRYEVDPACIRRTADVTLFFLDHQSPQQFQQLFGRLRDILNYRPADLHCHDYNVFGLLRLTRLLIRDSWANHLVNLSCRVSLLICSFWKLEYDIFSRGRMFVGLIAMSLLYCNGNPIAADDLPRRPENLGHSDTSPIDTFADHLHQNCSRFINADHKVVSEADWSLMLLGLHLDPSQQTSKELQIEHVANFVLPAHVDGLSRILHWCIAILNGPGFHRLHQNIINLCYSNPNCQETIDVSDMVAVTRYALHYHFISSFWQLRGKGTSASIPLDSDEIAILPTFRTFLDDFGLSEFDILRHQVEIFVSQLDHHDNTAATSPSEPRYLRPEVLSHLSHRFGNIKHSVNCKEVASMWLSCWMWGKEPLDMSGSRHTALNATLGNHVLRLISHDIEETHPYNRAIVRAEHQPAELEILPTLYEGIAGSRKVRLSGSGAERNSYNMTSSQTISKNHDQRYSGGSSDYAVFAKTAMGGNISPPKRSPTLPSEAFHDPQDLGSDVSKRWGFSGSSKSTPSSGTKNSGHRSISGFGIRNYMNATLSRRRRPSSSQLAQEDTKMEDFFQYDRKCMSPRMMSENSLVA